MKPVSAQAGLGLILVLVVVGLSIGLGFLTHLVTRPSDKTGLPASGGLLVSSSSADSNLALKEQISDLSKELEQLKQDKASKEDLSRMTDQLQALGSPAVSATKVVTSSSFKTPVYIPVGSSTDSVAATDWKNFDSLTFSIDPADYSGYTGMTLEVTLRSNAGGTAYARIANISDNKIEASSEVSTTSTTFAFLTSSSFKLSEGKKTYKIQGKNPTGDPIFIQNARVKVSF